MKNLLELSKIILLLLTGFTMLSCSNDKSASTFIEEPKNILEVAINEPDLSNIFTAIGLADGNLENLLSGGEYTLLAPNLRRNIIMGSKTSRFCPFCNP